MSHLESAVEARLVRAVQRAGALTYKLAPTTAGVPDRLVVWPTGRVDFVELKAEGGQTSSIQRVRIRELEEHLANVFVLYGPGEVDDYVETASLNAHALAPRAATTASWD